MLSAARRGEEAQMPVRSIHHVDLAVGDVERSLAFYREILEPLGVTEVVRYPTYRGTEEVVYFVIGDQFLGFRPADGGEHHYHHVGIEHLAFRLDSRQELEETHGRCLQLGAQVHFPPEEDRDIPGYWATFVFDPDGFRIEFVYWPESDESVG
jgi:catechol 2,3-dioxygenase-like lactoylglutathione lyase family enzyme